MSGMGVVRLGNDPVDPSPVPLGWQVQRLGERIRGELRWSEPLRSALRYSTPDEAKKALTARRKDKKYGLRLISGGIEFNTYLPGCAPCPELADARTRITWEPA